MPSSPPDFPIRDYGLIGNCETAALVNARGGIDWLCLPDFAGGSFFGALLDREKGGAFELEPRDAYEATQRYRGDSAILETRFQTETGTVLLTDFFVVARETKARFYDFTSLHPTRKLVRTLKLESGRAVPMRLAIRARPDYARSTTAWRAVAGGYRANEAAIFSSVPLSQADGDLVADFSITPDTEHFVVLDYNAAPTAPNAEAVAQWEKITAAFWHEWNLFNYYRGPHQAIVRRSAVTLKLLTYAPSGAFVAAPTTSLPEVPGGDANWDYRFTWLRDTGLLIDTLFRLGYSGEARAFLSFVVRQAEEDDSLGVLYSIRGGAVPEETELPHLRGYGGSQPIRLGNRARAQLQLDTSAHLLEAFRYFQHTGGKIDGPMRKLIAGAIDTLLQRWAEPENGIWESVEQRLYTFGKVSAWTGLTIAQSLAPERCAELEKARAAIREEVLARGLRTFGADRFLTQTFDNDEADAASLLAFACDFLPVELARSTRARVEEKLAEGALVFRNETMRANGEGAFVLCSCWRINHLIKEGEIARAEELLDALLEQRNALGLFAEEIAPGTDEFLGNFPQAFSHLGIIGTILNLDLAQRKPDRGRVSDCARFEQTVGLTIGWRGVIAGFFRVPKTLVLLFSNASKWRE